MYSEDRNGVPRSSESGKWQLIPYKTTLEEYETAFYIPATADLAYIAAAVYDDNSSSTAIKNLNEDDSEISPISEDWILLSTAHSGPPGISIINGYYGATYFNTKSKVLVIANRGTNLLNPGSLLTDVVAVIAAFYAPQTRSAYKYAKQMLDTFGCCASATYITGHSLGGWLSQASKFFLQFPQYGAAVAEILCDTFEWFLDINVKAEVVGGDPKTEHLALDLHCVVFESPGAFTFMEKFGKDPGDSGFLETVTGGTLTGLEDVVNLATLNTSPLVPPKKLQQKFLNFLDITTFLAQLPSDINAIKQHVGVGYSMKGILGHSSVTIVKFWQNGKKELGHEDLSYVHEWPLGIMIGGLRSCTPKTGPSSKSIVQTSFFTATQLKVLFHVKEIVDKTGQNVDWDEILGTGVCTPTCNEAFKSYKFVAENLEMHFEDATDMRATLSFFKHIFHCASDLSQKLEAKYGKADGWNNFEKLLGMTFWSAERHDGVLDLARNVVDSAVGGVVGGLVTDVAKIIKVPW